MSPLKFGHWIVKSEDGSLKATSYSPELGEHKVDMQRDGNVYVVIKSGASRTTCTLNRLDKEIQQIEAHGDYVREVFVADRSKLPFGF